MNFPAVAVHELGGLGVVLTTKDTKDTKETLCWFSWWARNEVMSNAEILFKDEGCKTMGAIFEVYYKEQYERPVL
jgi:hypothetical protein